jgi:hypothetical protein
MNVRVDVTGQNEFAHATDLSPERGDVLFAHRHPLNFITVDHHGRIRKHFAVRWINHSRADERDPFRVQRYDAQ